MRNFHFLTFVAAVVLTPAPATAQTARDRIVAIAGNSQCARTGEAKPAFIKGMALVFARAACNSRRADVLVASLPPSAPRSLRNGEDGASVYWNEAERLNLGDATDSESMLRRTYVIMTGLGFRESNGRYCVGRYTAQGFSRSFEAEAGPFQTSWGAHSSDPSLEPMFRAYQRDESACLLDVFSKDISCAAKDAKNWNSENAVDPPGVHWQALTKRCPAFAAEYASVVIRKHGGAHGEFGPIKCFAGTQPPKIQRNCKKVRLYPVCNAMYRQIQDYIKSDPAACAAL